jgi:signal transduction histidine kinase
VTEPQVERPGVRTRVAGSVRFRLTVTVVLVVGISLLGGGVLLVKWVEATLLNDQRNSSEQILGAMAEALGQSQIPAELKPSSTEGGAVQDGSFIAKLFRPGQTEVEGTIRTTVYFVEGPGGAQLKMTGGYDPRGRPTFVERAGPRLPAGEEAVHVARRAETAWGPMVLHAVSPVTEIERSVQTLTAALWLGLPVLVVGAGIMTWLITGRALAPVGLMTRRVRELSATTLDARVPVPPTDDEIAQLAQTMNEMLDRLQHASVAQRQFVSDASHELRSPVASIRAQLETALRYPEDVDWPSVARIVLEEDTRLEHLVGNLLAMARLEEGRLGPRGEVDLDDLVLSHTHRMTGVRLDLSGVSAGRVWGNADELTSVVRNLLDNAARHTSTTVKVSVRENGPWVVFTVADDGPGIAPEHRERIFERFARLQEGRSRDQGGTGLGLALSRRIVEHHGGRVHVEEAASGGAQFVVSLPAAGWTGREDDEDDASEDGEPAAGEPADGQPEQPVGSDPSEAAAPVRG